MTHPVQSDRWLRREFVALAASLAAGCGAADRTTPMRVAAASDLQKALPALVRDFSSGRGLAIETTFGASGQLAAQIAQGAPFDLFLSANTDFVRRLVGSGVIRAESVQPYATGSLVLAVHRASGVVVRSLADLVDPRVKKVAIANPDLAPYGLAARQTLERANLWDRLEGKIVRAETVLQAMQFVATGNAEVGFVGRAVADDPSVDVVPVDPASHDPIVQSLGVVTGSTHRKEAEAFAAYLLGPVAQQRLKERGFGPPPRPLPARTGKDPA